MSGDPDQEYFSDGIAEDIITELSRSRSLFVIARNSSFTYKGHAVDVKQVARELGVRYVVEGSVRRSGSRIRVTAQLIDAETAITSGRSVMIAASMTYSRFKMRLPYRGGDCDLRQSQMPNMRRVLRKPPESLGAWEAYQRGLWHMSKNQSAGQ